MSNLTSTDAVIVELYENPLTDRTDDRYGRVVNLASVNEETLIARAIARGFNGNAASMKAAFSAISDEALLAVGRSEMVQFGPVYVSIDVEGTFIGDAPTWDRLLHKLVARVVPAKMLREFLKTIPVRILGMAPDRSVISQVTDVTTGKVNESLTRGGMANIKGAHIKIVGDLPGVGLTLAGQEGQDPFPVPATSIGINDPSKISFVVPLNMPSGSYILSIGTQFTGGNGRFRKEVKTVTLDYILIID
ncbi:MAG: DUF4469 domain-containing protein [Tannerella sp.]|jgi:hypothetical protein|nr:DUF4469 domain-containing protein [Tannerella sp.]